MSTIFRELIFENGNSIAVQLTLEAPIGSVVINTDVRQNSTVTLNPNVTDVSAAKITVVAGGHEHTDTQTFELRGSPLPMHIETLKAHTRIGSINGVVIAAY